MLCDLNIPWPASAVNVQANVDAARRTAGDLAALGFHVVAFNQTVTGKLAPSLKSAISIVDPSEWKHDAYLVMTARGRGNASAIKQITRLTVILEDASQVSSLSPGNPVLDQFDLFAVTPTSEKMWAAACQTIECDIISLDMTQRLPFPFRHTMINEAIRRGIVFEVVYSGAFKDNTAKRNLISNASNLLRVTKGKHVIFSSGAKSALETRGPLDVVNLACLFGASQDAARHSITLSCRAALIHAETRRSTYRATASAEAASKLEPVESWKFGLGGDEDFVGFEKDESDGMEVE
ncbi:RNase P subunit p30-domain-containing protein [Blastocladiella britannica]|nr:RNase P subunit p30-domain-containing protein [Blastocladiella britannica]